MRTRLSHTILVLVALSSSAIAQNVPLNPTKPFDPALEQLAAPSPQTYGTSSEVVIAVPDVDFSPNSSTTTYATSAGKYTTGGGFVLEAGIRLPAGASITKVEVQACDTNASVNGGLSLCAKSNSSGVCTALETVTINANTGCALTTLSLTPAHTVNNAVNSYYLSWSNFPALDGTIKIQAARVYYKLQISPDPSTATFTDVPVGHPFHRFVEALYASGITGGCGGGNYCPDAPVTRGQMAVFLAGALGLHWVP